MSNSSPLAAVLIATFACGARATTPERSPETLVLTPVLVVGRTLVFHIEATIESSVTASGTQRETATLELDDRVEIVGPDRVRESFSKVTPHGDGELGGALARIAPQLGSASATTAFDTSWEVVTTTIDGAADDEARTMIMNLAPVVSFRMLPRGAVAVGDSWEAAWGSALRSQHGSGVGQIATGVHYKLDAIAACGARTCASVSADGNDAIPEHEGLSGTSTFHGELRVDAGDALPIAKTIRTATTLHGQRGGQPAEYTNTVTVRVTRRELATP